MWRSNLFFLVNTIIIIKCIKLFIIKIIMLPWVRLFFHCSGIRIYWRILICFLFSKSFHYFIRWQNILYWIQILIKTCISCLNNRVNTIIIIIFSKINFRIIRLVWIWSQFLIYWYFLDILVLFKLIDTNWVFITWNRFKLHSIKCIQSHTFFEFIIICYHLWIIFKFLIWWKLLCNW